MHTTARISSMSNGWCWENNFLQYHPCADPVALLICILHKGEFHCLYAVSTIVWKTVSFNDTPHPHCLSDLQNTVTWVKQLSILPSQHISFSWSAIHIILIIIAYCKILSGYKWRGLCSQASYARLHTLSVFTLIAPNLIFYALMLGESLTLELLHESFSWKWLGPLNRKTKSPVPYQRCQNSQSTRDTKQNCVVVHLLQTVILKSGTK